MADPEPPPWDSDSLSKYFRDVQYNERVSALRFPEAFELIRRAHEAFDRAEQIVAKGSSRATVLPRILLARSHSAFLAAARLALSGQATEGQIVLRSGIEQAWYALHIATDPAPFTRAEIWLKRHHSDEDTARSKQEFSVASVRASHEATDVDGASTMQWLYSTLIDFGAHPNQRGILGAITREEDDEKIDYRVGILQPDELRIMAALRLGVGVAIGALRIFQHLFPERFRIVGLEDEVQAIGAMGDALFARYSKPKTG